MRWEDEAYVRFYKRNTPEWSAMRWTSRGLFGLIMREVDRAGILELGKIGLKAVAVAVRAPWEEVEAPLRELLEDGCVVHREDLRILVLPNFMEAQEANASDKARQRTSRERARDLARAKSHGVLPPSQPVTPSRDEASHGVTESNANAVNGHPLHSSTDQTSSDQISTKPPLPPRGVSADESSPEAQRASPSALEMRPTPNGFDMLLESYSLAFRKRYRRDYVLPPIGGMHSDEQAFVRLGRHAVERAGLEGARKLIDHWVRAYFKDDWKWLDDNAYPIRQLEKRLNKYGEPKKPRPVVDKQPEPEPPKEETKPFVPLPDLEPPPARIESTRDELATKAKYDQERLAKAFGGGK